MKIEIRHVQPDDVEAVHEIFLNSRTIVGTMRLPYQALEHTRERLQPAADIIKLVAIVKSDIAGFCELVTYPDVPRHRHAGEINMIAVHDKCRGDGVGTALMEAMIDLADNWLQLRRLSLTVWSTNKTAIGLYEQFGFKIEGTMPEYVFGDGQYVDAHLMGRMNRN